MMTILDQLITRGLVEVEKWGGSKFWELRIGAIEIQMLSLKMGAWNRSALWRTHSCVPRSHSCERCEEAQPPYLRSTPTT